MISLTVVDEYGVTYAVDTFLSVQDAKDALWQLESYLDEAQTPARYYQLQDAISDLRQQISEHESNDEATGSL
jgi:hypothetical protein